ncbi:hypothetical protein FB451DRAFT_1413077 [Mycena latifolia]|nr:hypothetical protein FB451DRAFT_1413077 [Mycena latifolia]
MSQTDYKFRIALVGSGSTALSLAAFISRLTEAAVKSRIAVDIYDAKPEVSAIGAGAAIWNGPDKPCKTLALGKISL